MTTIAPDEDPAVPMIRATDEMARLALLPPSRRTEDRMRSLAVQVLSQLEPRNM